MQQEPKRPTAQPIKFGTQVVLVLGFGGLLAMMALAGIDSISVLVQIQARNSEIRQNFLTQERALEQVRAGLDLADARARDYLMERNPAAAERYRADLQAAHKQLEDDLARYAASLAPDQRRSFHDLETQVQSYWEALEPVFHWDAKEKQARADEFLHRELLQRRTATLAIADRIATMNQRELNGGNDELEVVFNSFRSRLIVVLAVTLTFGVVLAAGATLYLVRLARDAETRFRETVTAQQELKDLSARLVDMQEKERRTLSRELHDEVGQSLSAVLMEIGNMRAALPAHNPELRSHVDSIKSLAEASVKVVRNMTLLLRPSMLDDLGLLPALQWQAREVSRRTGMEVDVTAENVADDLPEDHRTCVYRVVQEALNNCARHSNAHSVHLTVTQDEERITLRVQDDGKGFDSRTVRGMGLLGMEERVTHLGGTFHVHSKPGDGATLVVELPGPGSIRPPAVRASA
jgi:signal transduction histidine kinase